MTINFAPDFHWTPQPHGTGSMRGCSIVSLEEPQVHLDMLVFLVDLPLTHIKNAPKSLPLPHCLLTRHQVSSEPDLQVSLILPGYPFYPTTSKIVPGITSESVMVSIKIIATGVRIVRLLTNAGYAGGSIRVVIVQVGD